MPGRPCSRASGSWYPADGPQPSSVWCERPSLKKPKSSPIPPRGWARRGTRAGTPPRLVRAPQSLDEPAVAPAAISGLPADGTPRRARGRKSWRRAVSTNRAAWRPNRRASSGIVSSSSGAGATLALNPNRAVRFAPIRLLLTCKQSTFPVTEWRGFSMSILLTIALSSRPMPGRPPRHVAATMNEVRPLARRARARLRMRAAVAWRSIDRRLDLPR